MRPYLSSVFTCRMAAVLCPGRCPSLWRLCPYRAFSLSKAVVLCTLFSVLYLNIYALCLCGAEGGEDAEHDANKDAHEHADESVEEEADVCAEIKPEDNGFAREESDECGHTAYALEEDADEEQTSDSAGEQTENRVEIVKKREDVPGGHKQS